MKVLPAALLLALASTGPALATTCPQEAQLRADPRWTRLDIDLCHHCDFNRTRVGPGARLRWNGKSITEAKLGVYLEIVARMRPTPVTLLVVESSADCALLARTAAAIETNAACGPGEFCSFGLAQAPTPRRSAPR